MHKQLLVKKSKELLKIRKYFINEKLKKVVEEKRMLQKIEKTQQKSTKEKSSMELSENIMFRELLMKEEPILIYDAGIKFFLKRYIGALLGAFILFFGFRDIKRRMKKKSIINQITFNLWQYFFPFCCYVYIRKISLKAVEKIIYDPKKKSFFFTQRNFYFPTKREFWVKKKNLMYIKDQEINAQWINYINMETLDPYLIHLKYAWVNYELWCHLVRKKPEKEMDFIKEFFNK
jgi:hypothetical protein